MIKETINCVALISNYNPNYNVRFQEDQYIWENSGIPFNFTKWPYEIINDRQDCVIFEFGTGWSYENCTRKTDNNALCQIFI